MRELKARILGDEKDFSRALDRAGKDADKFGKRLRGRMGGAFGAVAKGAGLAGAAAAGGLAAGLGFATKAAIEAEKSGARLSAQLRAMGKDTPEVNAALEKTINRVSQLGAFDDEDLSDAFVTLARTTGDTSGAMENLGLVADVARGAQLDLATASKLVGRVAAGQTSALSRYGIVLEKGATASEALAALQQKFGGQAEAYGKTVAGSMERAEVALENLGESLGERLAPAVAWLAEKGVELMDRFGPVVQAKLEAVVSWLEQNWPTIQRVVEAVFEALVKAWEGYGRPMMEALIAFSQTVAEYVRENWDAIRQTIDGALQFIQGLVDVFVGVLTGDWSRAWDGIKGIVSGALQYIEGLIRSVWPLIRSAMAALGRQMIEGIRAGLDALPGAVLTLLRAAVTGIAQLHLWAFGKAKEFGGEILRGVPAGIGRIADEVREKLGEGIDAIPGMAREAYDAAKSLGGRILAGIRDALSGIGSWVVEQIKGAINDLIDRFNSAVEFDFSVNTHIPGVGRVGVDIDPPDVPHLASGGVVLPRAGGTLARIGDGGEAEAVLPLSRLAALLAGGGFVQNNHFHGPIAESPQAAAAALSFEFRTLVA